MFEETDTPLVLYLRRAIEEHHFPSERAFAAHVGISPRTLGRILRGKKVDPGSLQRIADGLQVPIESLYRLAGYLQPEEAQDRVIREIESLLRQLPEADQRRILEVVRVEHRFHGLAKNTEGSREETKRKTG